MEKKNKALRGKMICTCLHAKEASAKTECQLIYFFKFFIRHCSYRMVVSPYCFGTKCLLSLFLIAKRNDWFPNFFFQTGPSLWMVINSVLSYY